MQHVVTQMITLSILIKSNDELQVFHGEQCYNESANRKVVIPLNCIITVEDLCREVSVRTGAKLNNLMIG